MCWHLKWTLKMWWIFYRKNWGEWWFLQAQVQGGTGPLLHGWMTSSSALIPLTNMLDFSLQIWEAILPSDRIWPMTHQKLHNCAPCDNISTVPSISLHSPSTHHLEDFKKISVPILVGRNKYVIIKISLTNRTIYRVRR